MAFTHVRIVRDIQSLLETGDRPVSDDELRARFPILFDRCAESIRRLDQFNREQWCRDEDDRWRSEGTVDYGGLDEHARNLLARDQSELAARQPQLNPDDAFELAFSRKVALEALIRVGRPEGGRHAKRVQSELAAPNPPLAVCVGTSYERRVEGIAFRAQGCLAIFEDAGYGRGNYWPSWCDPCRAKNGERNPRRTQERAFKHRIDEFIAAQ